MAAVGVPGGPEISWAKQLAAVARGVQPRLTRSINPHPVYVSRLPRHMRLIYWARPSVSLFVTDRKTSPVTQFRVPRTAAAYVKIWAHFNGIAINHHRRLSLLLKKHLFQKRKHPLPPLPHDWLHRFLAAVGASGHKHFVFLFSFSLLFQLLWFYAL